MCGIAGVFSYAPGAPEIDRSELLRVSDQMARRGPDGDGFWQSDGSRISFAHRRLSIIDLSDRGAQPMLSADGKLCIVFNGEIYNYRALREKLESKGHVFRSQSDTEVLLHLYADKGEDLVGDLRGMFAFSLWDAQRRVLLIARDPYGIKPLYFADDGRQFRFASQVKALLKGGGVSREPDPAGWAGYFLFGSVPEPFTTYQAIRALPAGSTLLIDENGPRQQKQYFSVAAEYCKAEQQGEPVYGDELQSLVKDAIFDSVRHHLVADVPIGVFLSSGIDSNSLIGVMHDLTQPEIKTITLSFNEFKDQSSDESVLARKIAQKYGTRHTERLITAQEFHDDLPKIMDAMDQPSIDGINIWFASKAAREQGLKVALSGLGGDELFGGYPSFYQLRRLVRIFGLTSGVPGMASMFRTAFNALNRNILRTNPKLAELLTYGGTYPGSYLLLRGLFLPSELSEIMSKDLIVEGLRRLQPLNYIANAMTPMSRSHFGKIASLETTLYMRNQLLRDTDWASMAHSVEVRLPYVDPVLLKKMAPVTTKQKVSNWKQILANCPSVPIPQVQVDRLKTGFETPVGTWIERSISSPQWRGVPSLTRVGCPWARRWAYEVAAAFA